MAETLDQTLEKLINAVDAANKDKRELSEEFGNLELGNKLKTLTKDVFSENAKQLNDSYKTAMKLIESDNEDKKSEGEEMLKLLQDSVGDEEDAAEKRKAIADQNNALLKVASGLEGFEKSLKGFADGATKGAFGISALLLLFNPEMFVSGLVKVIGFIKEGIDAVTAAFQGDFSKMLTFFKENMLAVIGTLAFMAVKFGVLSGIAKGFRTVVSAWRAVQLSLQSGLLFHAKELAKTAYGKVAKGITTAIRLVRGGMLAISVFMSGTVLPAIMGALSAAGAAIAPVLVAAAPFIAIGAALAGAIYLVVKYFDDIVDVFSSIGSWVSEKLTGLNTWISETFGIDIAGSLTEFWNSVTDGMGLLGLVTAPFRLIGDWIAEQFGFTAPEGEEGGFITHKLRGLWDSVKEWFSSILPSVDDIKSYFSGFSLFGDDPEPVAEQKPLSQMSEAEMKELAASNSGFFSSEEEEYAKLLQQRKAEEQGVSIEKTNPVSPIRDNQLQNNDLKAEEQMASNIVIQQNMMGGGSKTPPANVKASNINVTNNVDLDSYAKIFSNSYSF